MRIKKLILKNFRQFENLELDFTDENGKVLDVVVFAGVNGSGKSTILTILREVVHIVMNKFSNFGLLLNETPEILIELELFSKKFEKENREAVLHGRKEGAISRFITLSNFGKDEFNYFPKLREPLKNIENFLYFLSKQSVFLEKRGEFLYQSGMIETRINFEVTENSILKNIQSNILKDRHQAPNIVIQKIIDALNQALKTLKISTRLTDIESERLIFSNGVKNNLTFNDLSNGEKQLFFQIFTLYNLNLNNGILLIDEPEDAMHPTWQREILNVYKNIGTDNQVFVATHSPHILSSVKPESLYVLNIDEETGKIKAFNMAKERKNTKGLDPNRILTEIMGAPLRDYETQQRIDDLSALIKAANAAPNGNIQTIEDNLRELTTDLGRQDYNIMLFNNELMLLKRKKSKLEMA